MMNLKTIDKAVIAISIAAAAVSIVILQKIVGWRF